MKIISSILSKRSILYIALLFTSSPIMFAQSSQVTGSSPVDVNSVHTYQFTDGVKHLNYQWVVEGGIVLSQWHTRPSFIHNVSILWGTGSSGSVTFKSNGNPLGSKNVVINTSDSPKTVLSDDNYIYTIIPTIETTDISVLSKDNTIENVTYFDGLGRQKQINAIRGGKGGRFGNDIVTYLEYDSYGRKTKDYLPYPTSDNGGEYKMDALIKTKTYYKADHPNDFLGVLEQNINPYSERQLEASPLGRVQMSSAPGEDWKLGNGHEIKFDYAVNTLDEVKKYEVSLTFTNNTYTPLLSLNGSYPAGVLSKNIIKDENHTGTVKDGTTEEFKDKQGRIILKRTYNNNEEAHDTYYVYDVYGNLTYVLPPESEPQSALPDAVELTELCYQYKYDQKNRLVEKKIPGKDWEYIVYNNLNQPILTQDGNQRIPSTDKWLFTKYDIFGRVAYTGEIGRTISRTSLQTEVNSVSTNHVTKNSSPTTIDGTTIYYNNGAYPTSYITDILTINYYDNYTFDKVSGNSETSYGITPITDVKGLATGSKIKVLGANNTWITNVTYYDKKSNPIYVYSNNAYLNTTDKVKSDLDFTGTVLETTTTHARTGFSTIETVDTYEYDHMNRLVEQTQVIDSGSEEVIVQNTYDELGQLVQKRVGGTTAQNRLQEIDYTYNIRGWLKEINKPNSGLGNDLFAFKINYNTKSHSGTGSTLFNGNISETEWKNANDNILRWYQYDYDDLNRITEADFDNNYTGSDPLINAETYNLSVLDYDKNGNIRSLTRTGRYYQTPQYTGIEKYGVIDDLSYTYDTTSNKLLSVGDSSSNAFGFKNDNISGDDYDYDPNGNLTQDLNKNIIVISYNYLNLPELVVFGTGNTIEYKYDASGVKQVKMVHDNGTLVTTNYAGNFIYNKVGSSAEELKFFNHPEGYVEPDGSGGYEYVYQYKDHLGNIRLSYQDINNNGTIEASSEIIEEKNYYPFGLEHKGYNSNVISEHNYTNFQGQELTEDLGLNVHEWKYRISDPAIGRFWQIDPLAEDYEWMTTYQFSSNQPIHAPELEGLESGYDLNTRLYMEGKITKDQYFGNINTRATGAAIGLGVAVDVVVTKGAITKSLVEQTVLNTTINGANQLLDGGVENLDFGEAAGDAIGNADLFDAGMDALTSKLPGGKIINEVIENVATSMVDVTNDGGVQIGGDNKNMSEVALDLTFSTATNKIKNFPNAKFSGTGLGKSMIDVASGISRNNLPSSNTKPAVGRRKSTNTSERGMNIKVRDNTRVRQ